MDLNTHYNLIQGSPFGIAYYEMITDDKGLLTDLILTEVNDAFLNITESWNRSLKGNSVKELFQEKEYLNKLYKEIFATNGSWEYELYRPENGNWYTVKTSKRAGILFTLFVDITTYKSRTEDLETFFDLNLDMFSIADMSGHFLKLNKAWEDTLGYSVQELEMTNFLELIHPDDLEASKKALARLGDNTLIPSFTNRYMGKNGEYHFLEWKSMTSGGLIYSSCRDVTNLVLQARQIETKKMFRQIIDNVGGVFWLLSAEVHELIYVSPNHVELFGQELKIGDNLFSLINQVVHPLDRELVAGKFQDLQTSGKFQVEIRLLLHDNKEVWVSSSGFSVQDEDGNLIRIAGLIQDITQRKQAELANAENTNRLKAMLNALPDVLITHNINGEYLDLSASDPSKRIFGHADIKGKHISDFFDADLTARFMNAILRSIELQSLQTIRFEYVQNGEVRHFENRFIPIDNEKVLSVVRDISETAG